MTRPASRPPVGSLRIGLVTSSFPRFSGDHAGSFVLGFARALARRGHRVEVLAPEPAGSTGELDEAAALSVTRVPYLRPRSLQRTFYGAGAPENLGLDPLAWLGVLPFAAALRRAVARRAPSWDAVVSHWAIPSALVAGQVLGPFDAEAARGRPHLVVCHSGDVHLLARLPGGPAIARAVTRRASALLFVSAPLRNLWLAMLGPLEGAEAAGRSHVCPMGIDLPVTLPRRRDARALWRLDRFTLLAITRLVPVKGLDVLARATAGRRDLEVVVAGEGPERDRLARLAGRCGAPFRFVGAVGSEAKAELLAGADAFVVPSRCLASGRTEGVPVAMLEAMGAGLPVIASSVGGIGALVEPRAAAVLVPPDAPRELSDAITRLAASAPLRRKLSRAGRSLARSLEWDRLAPWIEQLLEPGLAAAVRWG